MSPCKASPRSVASTWRLFLRLPAVDSCFLRCYSNGPHDVIHQRTPGLSNAATSDASVDGSRDSAVFRAAFRSPSSPKLLPRACHARSLHLSRSFYFTNSTGVGYPIRGASSASRSGSPSVAGQGGDGAAAGAGGNADVAVGRSLADEMIQFAEACLERDRRDGGSDGVQEALRVLEHGAALLTSQAQSGSQGEQAAAAAAAAVQLLQCQAALHARRYNLSSAVEALADVADMENAPMGDRVSALEATVRLHLSCHMDSHAMEAARKAALLLQPPQSTVHTAGKSGTDTSAAPPPPSSSSPLPHHHPPSCGGLAALRFRVLCAAGLVEQMCGHVAAAREHFWEAEELEPPNCEAIPATALARLSACQHLHSVGLTAEARAGYHGLVGSTDDAADASTVASADALTAADATSSSSSPTSHSPLIPSVIPEASIRVASLAGLGQIALREGIFSEAEERFTEALKEAEAIDDRTEFNPLVGAVLSLLADTYGQRGKSKHTGEGVLAEGLFRRSLSFLGASQWGDLDHRMALVAANAAASHVLLSSTDEAEEQLKDRKNRALQLDLIAFTLERYVAVLEAFPMRVGETQAMKAAALHLWRSSVSLESAMSLSRAADCAHENAVLDVVTGRILLS